MAVIPFRATRIPRMQLPFSTPGSKAAQISTFPEFEGVEPFGTERWADLQAFRPGTLVGYGFDLKRLADRHKRGELDVPTLEHAIFALTDCGTNPISGTLRMTLWHTFGVPVYELIIAPGCQLLAAECEAHDGWHLQEGAQAYLIDGELVCDLPAVENLHTGLSGDIETEPCGCGRTTTRLKNLTPYLPRPTRQCLSAAA